MENKNYRRVLIFFLMCLFALVSALTSHISVNAVQPSSVLIHNSVNFKNRGLRILRRDKESSEPIRNKETQLKAFQDALIVEADKNSWAEFIHILDQQKYGGLIMKTLIRKTPSEYWFYCRAKGNFLMAWREGGEDRACGDGLKLTSIRKNSRIKSSFNFNTSEIAQANKSLDLAQASDEITLVPGSQGTVVQTFDSGSDITIEVIKGDIRVISPKVPQGKLIQKGKRYTYPQNTTEPIDTDSITQRPEVKEFLGPTNWLSPDIPQVIADAISAQLSPEISSKPIECHGKEILTARACVGDGIEPEEAKLVELINQYRSQNNLSPISVSKALTLVANRHVRDMAENIKDLTHSWSDCSIDSKGWICLWEAPKRLATTYDGHGYENAYWSSSEATAEDALKSWKKDPPHNSLIVNQDIWKNRQWKALGTGIYEGYAVMWVGEESDPS